MGTTQLSLERLLQIVLAGMVILATMLFGAGHRSPLLVCSVALLATAAVYLVDVKGRFRLTRGWANLLSMTAVAIWLAESLVLTGELQLVAVTYVLLVLQLLLLCQAKGERVYWQLIALSVAQAAVAAALTPGAFFPILLVAYTMLGLLAFAMLLMYRELALFGPGASVRVAPATAAVLDGGFASAGQGGLGPRISAARPALQFVGSAAELPQAVWQRTLMRQTATIVICSLVGACVVFVLFPRVERGGEVDEALRSVGFSKEVTLGEQAGEATQNPDVVMRVQLFDEPSGAPMQLMGEPLFRGSVATTYAHGKWRQSQSISTRPIEPVRAERYVRQHITIEPLEDNALFSIVPAFRCDEDERLRIDYTATEIVRPRSARMQRMEFDLATTGIVDRRQAKVIPLYDRFSTRHSQLLQMPGGETDPLAGLRAAAARVKQQAQLAEDDRIGLAQALESYLRDSGDFQYTLQGQKRNTGVDPIEDFVVEHRRGHCEYFAGALALMLRSQGIPARVAIGFRAGEWNSAGGYYQVRQLHAHSWVEALLEPQHVAKDDRGLGASATNGAWLILDPTPAGEGPLNEGFSLNLWRRAGMYLDYLQVLWGKYISALDARSQQEAIYAPLGRLFGSMFEELFSFDTWSNWFSSAVAAVTAPLRWFRLHWFSLWGALSGMLVVLTVTGAYRGLRASAAWWRLRSGSRLGPRRFAGRSQHEMYYRLERALARRGLLRLAGQTPFEFAIAAGGDLAENIELIPLSALPRRVVEAFYRIRFGNRPLDNSEAKAVEHALRTLEEKL